jgi:L-ascorbate metabolism protein UlaG (beta-lactamase superfamily)
MVLVRNFVNGKRLIRCAGMLSTTFLGHQGWLFQSKTSSFLVDPLLCEEFGHVQELEYRVYPPRVFSFDLFPRIDGVVLTHEHDDHFDLASLARL